MGILKNLTKEYFGDIEREEDKIIGLERHSFTDKNGVFHEKGYYIKDGDKKQLRRLIEKLIRERGKNCDLNDIDVSNVTDMSSLFSSFTEYNNNTYFYGDVSGWDVSSVENMSFMFSFCLDFNCDISLWDVSSVTDMSFMFSFCRKFNQNLNNWNVKSVTKMQGMFEYCVNFNHSVLWGEKTKNVIWFYDMFDHCENFDKPIKLDTSGASNIDRMFRGCKKFNQDISDWKMIKLRTMDNIFEDCEKFDQDLSDWIVSSSCSHKDAFLNCPIKEEHKPKFKN